MSFSDEFNKSADIILAQGCEKLALNTGIVSNICFDIYEIVALKSNNPNSKTGATFDLGETYCREVVTLGGTVAITELAGMPGLQGHPLYSSMPLETYISTPIYFEGKIWGTLNFSSQVIRDKEFSSQDRQWLEDSALKLSKLLHKQ